jgi:hypothetical protein
MSGRWKEKRTHSHQHRTLLMSLLLFLTHAITLLIPNIVSPSPHFPSKRQQYNDIKMKSTEVLSHFGCRLQRILVSKVGDVWFASVARNVAKLSIVVGKIVRTQYRSVMINDFGDG